MGGLAALTLVVAVACSGAADTVDSTVFTPPTTEQVSDNGDSPDIKSTGVTPSSEIESFGSEPSTSTKSSVADDPGDTIEAIFDEYEVSEPTGDALQELVPEVDSPEVAPEVTPEVMISELTSAEIVAAQGDHLAGPTCMSRPSNRSYLYVPARRRPRALDRALCGIPTDMSSRITMLCRVHLL